MGFIAEYTIDSPVLQHTHEAIPEMRLEMEDLQVLEGGQARYVFWAEGAPFGEFETALSEDETIETFAVLTDLGDRRLYRVNFTAEARKKMTYPEASRSDIVFLGAESTGDGVQFRTQVPTREALSSLREICERKGLSFQLDRIYQEGVTETRRDYGLTDRQHEALVLAYERGYYGSERDATLEDLGEELDISPQAVADRLRRGHEHLVANTLA